MNKRSIIYFPVLILFVSVAYISLSHLPAFASGELTQSFTLDGQLFQTNTDQPLLDPNVKIVIQIMDPQKKCLLYEEEHYVDTTTSNGYYNIQVGSALGAPQRTSNDPGRTIAQIFQNSSPISSQVVSGQTCPGSTYTPLSGDSRYFRMLVTPSTTGISDTLSPDTLLSSVPSATVAQTLQGFEPNQFLQVGFGDLTQSNLDTVFASGNVAKLNTLLSANPSNYVLKNSTNGTIQIPSASNPSSLGAGSIWFDSVANKLKYYNGSTTQTVNVTGDGINGLGLTPVNGGVLYSTSTDLALTAAGTSGQVLTSNGAAAPSWSTLNDSSKVAKSGDSMTGALSLPTDGLSVGTSQLVVSSGKVGIGTANPNYSLHVNGMITGGTLGSKINLLDLSSSNTTGEMKFRLDTASSQVQLLIGKQGNVGTGDVLLQTQPLSTGYGVLETWNGAGTVIGTGSSSNATPTPIIFRMNRSEQMRIHTNDNVGIGVTNPSYKLDVNGDINTSTCFRIGATTVSGTCTSDERLKENIQDYTAGLKELMGVRLRTYQFNGLGGMPKTGETAVGVIAQELEKTNPDLVKNRMVKMHPEDSNDTKIKTVDYSKFTFMLINAVKEIYSHLIDIEALKKENETLKSETTQLKKQVDQAESRAHKIEKELFDINHRLERIEKSSQCYAH